MQAGSHVKAVRVGIGVAVSEGAPKPDVSTPDAFKKAITAARNIVYTDPATPNGSGIVTMRILAAAGLVDAVKAKGKQEGLGPGKELIAKGDYEMGLFNVSEATARAWWSPAGPGPVAGLHQLRRSRDGGRRQQGRGRGLLKFLTGKAAAASWKAGGVDAT